MLRELAGLFLTIPIVTSQKMLFNSVYPVKKTFGLRLEHIRPQSKLVLSMKRHEFINKSPAMLEKNVLPLQGVVPGQFDDADDDETMHNHDCHHQQTFMYIDRPQTEETSPANKIGERSVKYSSDADVSSMSTGSSSSNSINSISPHSIILPEDRTENDILLGRGKGPNNWIGNKRFREIIAKYQLEYFQSSRRNKPNLAKQLTDQIRSQVPASRFLQLDSASGYWFEVSEDEAIRKTSQALREGKLQRKKKSKNPTLKKTSPKTKAETGVTSKSIPSPTVRSSSPTSSLGPLKKRKSKDMPSFSPPESSSSIDAAFVLLAVQQKRDSI